jgi:hypothetical protein
MVFLEGDNARREIDGVRLQPDRSGISGISASNNCDGPRTSAVVNADFNRRPDVWCARVPIAAEKTLLYDAFVP